MNTNLVNFERTAVIAKVSLFLSLFLNLSLGQTAPPSTLKAEANSNCTTVATIAPSSIWQGSALNRAAKELNVAQVRKLLVNDLEIDSTDSFGNTALNNVLQQTIAEPIKKSRDVSLREKRKEAQAKLQIAQLLLERKANPNIKGINGTVALVSAVKMDESVVLKALTLLLKNEANLDIQDDQGYTALMEASRTNRANVVTFLLKNGANKALKSCEGKTALLIAQQFNFGKVAQLLEP
jgi:ankyrin repeat protein